MRPALLLLTFVVIVSLSACRTCPESNDPAWNASKIRQSRIKEVTFAEIESAKHKGMPVPEAEAGWTNFKRQAIQGDHVWYFCFKVPGSDALRRGYAIFRADKLMATFTVLDE